MGFTEADLNSIKPLAEEEYRKIGEVFCPYLQGKVSFNAKGLDHIKFKDWDKARPVQDQYMRLRLLKIAPEILKKSHTLQEFFEKNRLERQKINSRWEMRMIHVKYYGFVSIVNSDCHRGWPFSSLSESRALIPMLTMPRAAPAPITPS